MVDVVIYFRRYLTNEKKKNSVTNITQKEVKLGYAGCILKTK